MYFVHWMMIGATLISAFSTFILMRFKVHHMVASMIAPVILYIWAILYPDYRFENFFNFWKPSLAGFVFMFGIIGSQIVRVFYQMIRIRRGEY